VILRYRSRFVYWHKFTKQNSMLLYVSRFSWKNFSCNSSASVKIDVAQLKRQAIVYKISRYKLATRFVDSFEIIAITRSALFNTTHHTPFALPGRMINKQYRMSSTWCDFEICPGPPHELTGCVPSDLGTRLRLKLEIRFGQGGGRREWGEGTGPYLREGIPPLNTALCHSPLLYWDRPRSETDVYWELWRCIQVVPPPSRNYDGIFMDQSFSQYFHCNPWKPTMMNSVSYFSGESLCEQFANCTVRGYRCGSPTAVQAWQPCPLWEPSLTYPILWCSLKDLLCLFCVYPLCVSYCMCICVFCCFHCLICLL